MHLVGSLYIICLDTVTIQHTTNVIFLTFILQNKSVCFFTIHLSSSKTACNETAYPLYMMERKILRTSGFQVKQVQFIIHYDYTLWKQRECREFGAVCDRKNWNVLYIITVMNQRHVSWPAYKTWDQCHLYLIPSSEENERTKMSTLVKQALVLTTATAAVLNGFKFLLHD